jgi:hypothetical protein
MINLIILLFLTITAQAKVLYIVGMETEAQVVRSPNSDVVIGGGNAGELTELLSHIDPAQYSAVVHLGIVGALKPGLSVADIVLPSEVKYGNQTWHPTPKSYEEITAQMRKCGMPFQSVVMTASPLPVASVEERAALWQATGAGIVDTQVNVSAAWATANRLPFLVIGAVSDDSATNLPPAALIPLAADGTPAMRWVLLSVLLHPMQIAELRQLGKNLDAALANLSRVVKCTAGE